MKFTQFLFIALLVLCVSAYDLHKAPSLLHSSSKNDYGFLIGSVNSQLAALQASIAANTNAITLSSGQMTNINNQLAAALASSNAAANATSVTAQRLNSFIQTIIAGERLIKAAYEANPNTTSLVPAEKAKLLTLEAFQ